MVNLLLGGYDVETNRPHLYWIDYLGTLTEVPFASHGYGGYFALSLLDRYGFFIDIINTEFSIVPRYHNPEGSLEEGLETLKRCIDQVAKRLVVSPDKYKIKVVDKDGVREVTL